MMPPLPSRHHDQERAGLTDPARPERDVVLVSVSGLGVGDGCLVGFGIAAFRDAVEGSLQDDVVFEGVDLGDAGPAHGHVLHEDVVVGRAVGQGRVDSDAGGDPGSPRAAGDDDLFDLEGGVVAVGWSGVS